MNNRDDRVEIPRHHSRVVSSFMYEHRDSNQRFFFRIEGEGKKWHVQSHCWPCFSRWTHSTVRRFGRFCLVSRVTSNDPENIITISFGAPFRRHNTHPTRRRRIALSFRFTTRSPSQQYKRCTEAPYGFPDDIPRSWTSPNLISFRFFFFFTAIKIKKILFERIHNRWNPLILIEIHKPNAYEP